MTKCLVLETEVSMLQHQRQPQDTIMSRFQPLLSDYTEILILQSFYIYFFVKFVLSI